jgi:hypothetical protein
MGIEIPGFKGAPALKTTDILGGNTGPFPPLMADFSKLNATSIEQRSGPPGSVSVIAVLGEIEGKEVEIQFWTDSHSKLRATVSGEGTSANDATDEELQAMYEPLAKAAREAHGPDVAIYVAALNQITDMLGGIQTGGDIFAGGNTGPFKPDSDGNIFAGGNTGPFKPDADIFPGAEIFDGGNTGPFKPE